MEDYHSLYCTPEGRLLVVDLNERSYCQVGHKFRGPFGPVVPFCHFVRGEWGISIAEVSVDIEP